MQLVAGYSALTSHCAAVAFIQAAAAKPSRVLVEILQSFFGHIISLTLHSLFSSFHHIRTHTRARIARIRSTDNDRELINAAQSSRDVLIGSPDIYERTFRLERMRCN